MTNFIPYLALWGLLGAACSTWMFLHEKLRQRRYAAVRVRRDR
jgi:hypothetical protein